MGVRRAALRRLPPPSPDVASARTEALANVQPFLSRLPELRLGPETVPPAPPERDVRPPRARDRPDPFPVPVPGMTFIEDAWLERPRGVDHAAEFVRAGLTPQHLRAVYPRHHVQTRSGSGRRACGDRFASTWLGAGLNPSEAASWLGTGLWPCCARRWSRAGVRPHEAAAWHTAGFERPEEAGQWADETFGPDEARAWADAGVASAPSARACRDAGLTPREVVKWAWLWGGRRARSPRPSRTPSPGAADLRQLGAWRAAGLSGKDAHLWSRAGFKPSEAAMWPPGHPKRPDEVVLAAMAAISS